MTTQKKNMKTLLTLIISLVVGTLGLSSTAEAGHLRVGFTTYYTSGHHSCGCAIKMKKVFLSYARCGTPIFRYYYVPTSHRCHHYRSQHPNRHDRYSHRGHYYRRDYSKRRSTQHRQRG